ncbi:hypothetical protein SynSYN20_01930 [Synechococcus sp. SYN20]|nr:hypothetical protein SynSYN20_01930 [Synechococcus sp. SYN20]
MSTSGQRTILPFRFMSKPLKKAFTGYWVKYLQLQVIHCSALVSLEKSTKHSPVTNDSFASQQASIIKENALLR